MVQSLNTVLRRLPIWPLYVLCALYIVQLFVRGVIGQLGVDPVKAMEHALGEKALWLLIVTLTVTPLRTWTGITLLRFRRALGLITFFLALAHFTVWLVLDVQILSQIWADILKRPYVTVGFAAFLLMLPLAVTSNAASIRRMGAGSWRRLHKLIYPSAVLAAVHFVMLAKGFQIEPLIYLGIIAILLASRLPIGRWRAAILS
ncbi:protein-methionine-sulfoxide reductase heme-binding subunit MsrQ [Chachezhania antarctica]|uniref:protein-methionine-sulfoxide reductase heme-binding subunit MsrQ n=1 Tax=Chachezhania antarctica TaxID=2340860 RepID=UPI000EAD5545|nr:protein-methionine-sulfoxide reductase heme-binding subunit MsrQ [Chachezhania antarctica]|tara:strand:+ start:11597 stop:12205 length:609 start_codon:yes stop_codon:yes gene_type:complete